MASSDASTGLRLSATTFRKGVSAAITPNVIRCYRSGIAQERVKCRALNRFPCESCGAACKRSACAAALRSELVECVARAGQVLGKEQVERREICVQSNQWVLPRPIVGRCR